MATSPNECVPEFTAVQGSFKCCNTAVKNMKLVIKVTDANGCLDDATDVVCITDIQLANGQDRGTLVFEGGDQCTPVGDTITAFLLDTDSCTVNLLISYTLNGGSPLVAPLKSGNIPAGNTAGACQP